MISCLIAPEPDPGYVRLLQIEENSAELEKLAKLQESEGQILDSESQDHGWMNFFRAVGVDSSSLQVGTDDMNDSSPAWKFGRNMASCYGPTTTVHTQTTCFYDSRQLKHSQAEQEDITFVEEDCYAFKGGCNDDASTY